MSTVYKSIYGDDIRRFVLEDDSFAGLSAKIASLYGFSEDEEYTIKFEDDDGDYITIACDDDVIASKAVESPNGNPLGFIRLSVIRPGLSAMPTKSAAAEPIGVNEEKMPTQEPQIAPNVPDRKSVV